MKLWPKYSPKYHERKKHLTPQLRDKFKSIGERLVERELDRETYSQPEKRLAALAWLEEQRETAAVRQGRSEALKWVFIVLGGIAAIAGIVRLTSGCPGGAAVGMCQSWFDLHQTFIGSLIVLAGVIIGLLGNGKLQRIDRDAKQDQEREIVRVALLEELRSLLETYENRAKEMEDKEREYKERQEKEQAGGEAQAAERPIDVFLFTSDPQTHLYHGRIDKLGILGGETLAPVLRAFLSSDHLPIDLIPYALYPTPPNVSEHFIAIPRKHFGVAKGMFDKHVQRLHQAIEALEKAIPAGR